MKYLAMAVILMIVGIECTIAQNFTQPATKVDKDNTEINQPEEKQIQDSTLNVSQVAVILNKQDISITQAQGDLDPLIFKTPDGKNGWKVKIPGSKPLATPAVVDGVVFIGGGFGSHEFYAIDSATGKKLWMYRTADDGPTTAVVEDGYVVFNTESCELEVITMKGDPVWKKWLGDPLMSTPAVSNGRIYMAFPDSKGDKNHYLACFNLKTGDEYWRKQITGELITCPVVDRDNVYAATIGGSIYCFSASNGNLVWSSNNDNVTSSPTVWNGQCYYSQRKEVTVKENGKDVKQQTELLALRKADMHASLSLRQVSNTKADYLDYTKKVTTEFEGEQQALDDSVGFGGGKGDSKMKQAESNLGEASVHGVWAYQGARPFAYKEQLYTTMGSLLNCMDLKTNKVRWQKEIKCSTDQKQSETRALTPPVLVNGKIFLCSFYGDIICLDASTGDLIWNTNIKESISFQPVVVKGKLYISTYSGSIFCIETGDLSDDGWKMWGANAQHNGLIK